MSADSPNDQELALKKRARRRLVGAIALVLLMIIVLPIVLQDRAALAPQEAIKITMPEDSVTPLPPPAETPIAPVAPPVAQADVTEPANTEPPTVTEEAVATEPISMPEVKKAEVKRPEVKKPEAKPLALKPAEVAKPAETAKPAEEKPQENKPSLKNAESFTIQVGVFSEMANVKQLQARLKQAGLDSRTENISTPSGEKIRLKAGRFASRQEAAYALTKLQAVNLTGMVITNK